MFQTVVMRMDIRQKSVISLSIQLIVNKDESLFYINLILKYMCSSQICIIASLSGGSTPCRFFFP
jgi:hypothetical protein